MSEQENSGITDNRPLTLRQAGAKISEIRKAEQSEANRNPDQPAPNEPPSNEDKEHDTRQPREKPKAEPAPKDDPSGEDRELEEDNTDLDVDTDADDDLDPEDLDDLEEGDEDDEGEDDDDAEEDGEFGDDDDELDDDDDLIEVPGLEEKVTAEELINGYMRHSDYTKKTKELAEQRKEIETIREEISDLPEVRKQYQETGKNFAQTAAIVMKILDEKFIPSAPDPALAEDDPARYVRLKEQRQDALQFKNAVIQEAQRLEMQNKQFLQQSIVEGGKKLRAEYPPMRSEEEQDALRKHLVKNYGYTDEQINTNADHNLFIMAHKAMKYDQLLEKQRNMKPKRKKPKVLKSKKGREDKGTTAERKRTEAINQHKKVGSIRSAADAIKENIRANKLRKRRRR